MSRVNAEVTRSIKSAVVRRQFYFIAYNVLQIGEGYELNKMIMEYEGKLYGKLGFKQYFDTGKTSKDWDSMERKIAELNEELSKLRQGAVSGTLPTYNICGGCGADNPSKRCIGCRHVFGNGH